jgi:hypothetical protein
VDLVPTPGLSHCRHRKPSLLQGKHADAFRRRQGVAQCARRRREGELKINQGKTQMLTDKTVAAFEFGFFRAHP